MTPGTLDTLEVLGEHHIAMNSLEACVAKNWEAFGIGGLHVEPGGENENEEQRRGSNEAPMDVRREGECRESPQTSRRDGTISKHMVKQIREASTKLLAAPTQALQVRAVRENRDNPLAMEYPRAAESCGTDAEGENQEPFQL